MFRFVKISLLTLSAVSTIVGFLLVFMGCIVIYLNGPTIRLFTMIQEECKQSSEEFGGSDLTTTFTYITIQAYCSIPLGVCITVAGAISLFGTGNLDLKLLKISLSIWFVAFIALIIFSIYSAVAIVGIDDRYLYCWLSVLTDLLQKGATNENKAMALIGQTEKSLDCCGVRGPKDYSFYAEMFGKPGVPMSCCYSNKHKAYDCSPGNVALKVGCFVGIRNGINNRKQMYGFSLGILAFFIGPLIYEIFWFIRGMRRHQHVHEEDMEDSSEDSDDESTQIVKT